MEQQQLTIAFTGGGTGGHVTPIVSLIEYVQNHSEVGDKCKQLYWFGAARSLEEVACNQLAGVTFVPVQAGKLRRYRDISSTRHNIIDMCRVVIAFFQSCFFLVRYDIDVVFCKGGYVALPVCIAAKLLRKKIMLHESDMHAGLTNRVVARFADTRFVGFPGTFSDEIVTGQIFSSHLARYVKEEKEPLKKHILIMGGSQGAQTLLHFVYASTQIFYNMNCVVTVILGSKNMSWREKLSGHDHIILYDHVDQTTLASLYAQTDIAITRAGVTSLAEQQLFGIKKIIVPHPHGGGYHQLYNALWYSKMYEDVVLEESDHLHEDLIIFLKKLVEQKKQWSGIDVHQLAYSKTIIWQYIVG